MGSISLKTKSKSNNLTAPGDVDPGAMIPIATVTADGTASSVTFTSIPQTYTHLQIRGIARNTAAGSGDYDLLMRYNSDSGSNYARHRVYGSGSAAAADAATSTTYAHGGLVLGGGAASNLFGGFVTDILDYTNTNKYKTSRFLAAYDANGSGYIFFGSSVWMSTSAVTSITLSTGSNNLANYSSFALYGIKTAGA
jgi:hypothetical protein